MHDNKSTRSNMDDQETPKFTVSQIMLLQKLKQSGLTKDQIIRGLEEIEKLDDAGLGSPGTSVVSNLSGIVNGTSPSSSNGNAPTTNGGAQMGSTVNHVKESAEYQRRSISPQSPPHHVKLNTSLPHHIGQANPLMFGTHLQNPNQLSLLPPVAQWPNTSQAVAVATAASLLQNGFAHGTVPHYPALLNNRGMLRATATSGGNGSTVVEIDGEKVDISEELDELFRRDQASVKEDIRKFISERHISQSSIAKATRNAISQSYISQWLAQPQDISGQKKKAMYTWYIIEKRKPPGMSNGMGVSNPVVYRSSESDQDMMSTLLMKAKRGARFTWPKECLSILENYYNANSYPDESKREEIAHACNSIIQSQKPGGVLSDLDKVTTVKVYNWFANRRKDDKRRRHIEHIEAMDQHQSHSPRRSSTVSPTPSCNSNDSHSGGDNTPGAHERCPPALVIPKKEDPMTLALEMAAVNHSILALVNQHNTSNHQHHHPAQQPSHHTSNSTNQHDESRDDIDDDEMDNDVTFDRSHDDQPSPGHEAAHHHRHHRYGQMQAERMTAECGSYAG
uniref:Homeobox-containing protein 1 n=1 Tax=Phallusia mammillata TaxID=59560 RepID=A0A6F9DF62_9ASCI|nr:homeobox-containing protein 1 [Phallusia mammillata]